MEVYLKAILTPLVSAPEAVSIIRAVDERGVLYTIVVAQPDRALVIGKAGVTANAIRHLVHAVGMRNKEHATVKFDF